MMAKAADEIVFISDETFRFQSRCTRSTRTFVPGVAHSIGGADGGVQGGVGVAEPVGTEGFEGAIEVAQGLCGN